MTGLSKVAIKPPLELAWTAELGNKARKEGIIATPVTAEGRAYIGSQSGKFACLQLSDGKILWEKTFKGQIEGNAAFLGELVIFGCTDGFVYALQRADGKEVWKFETEGEVHAGATVTKDAQHGEILLIGSYDNRLYALNAKGEKLWSYETTNYINGAVATFQQKVIFGGCDGILYILDTHTGKEVKTIDVGAYIGNNVAIADAQVYLGHYGNKVTAYDFATAKQIWEFGERDFAFYAAPAVTEETVFAGGRDKRLHALNRKTGESLWQFRTRGDVDSSPVVCANESVLFGSNDGNLYLLSAKDGSELWKYTIGAAVKSSAAVTDSFVLIGADDGLLYAFKVPANKPADTPQS